jgi:hypothetical protein
MTSPLKTLLVAFASASLLLGTTVATSAKTIQFAGHAWTVRPNGVGAPRNNRWCQANASVDGKGRLHLRLTKTTRGWCSAEVSTTERMGFGTYQWQLDTRLDTLDKNVVLGLFNYPPADVGGDSTNEIDIELSHWGNAAWDPLNYTIYPRVAGVRHTTIAFPMTFEGSASTHRFNWTPKSIRFQALRGHRDDDGAAIRDWTFAPKRPSRQIAQAPMPVYMNLWLVAPPSDDTPVEIIISDFRYTPAR